MSRFKFKTNIDLRYQSGESTIVIAKDEHCDPHTIIAGLRRMGIKIRSKGGNRPWTKKDIDRLEKLWKGRNSYLDDIYLKLGRTQASVLDMIKKRKLRILYPKINKFRSKICMRCSKKYYPSKTTQKYCKKCKEKIEGIRSARALKKKYSENSEFRKSEKIRKAIWWKKKQGN